MEIKTVEVSYNGYGEIVGLSYLDEHDEIIPNLDVVFDERDDELSDREDMILMYSTLINALESAKANSVKFVVDPELDIDEPQDINSYIQNVREFIEEVW